ncbi:DNA-processing protein DprA [Rivularia sp. UHCC 0363]|uniref:DNA-processing protein DprA n=1 Tax=Rivularia sp. UHCC 0363 TaxID=3110244 RepID=UPI002B1E9F26|nr:DNA-processing protein DprA [Rivularia sp. UHCC 0363]MEA5597193.1 DNA-processing protein DprA [Rivularia sp. UHCC 0363]
MTERAYWLAWSRVSGIGPVLLQRLYQHFDSPKTAWEANSAQLGEVEGFGFQTLQKVVQQRTQINPELFLTQHEQENPNFWTPADAEYPRLLRETPSPPTVLYYCGEVELTENSAEKPLVAIVGTRQPTEYGIRWTRRISTALVENGFTVVSGLAEGIDTAAHSAAIKAGGRTIAALGTGVDIVYPAKNRELYKQILAQGIVVSEYPTKTAPHRTHFPRRNRIIAGLSRAVLVMEAPQKSGALITADYANEFGRDVYALPGRLDDFSSQGCLKLVSQGATPILKELDELLKMLGAIPQVANIKNLTVDEEKPLPDLPPELHRVMKAISSESLPFDFIIQQTQMPASEVSSALLQLELMGLVSQLPGMRYQRN